jgi:hypothetical protein
MAIRDPSTLASCYYGSSDVVAVKTYFDQEAYTFPITKRLHIVVSFIMIINGVIDISTVLTNRRTTAKLCVTHDGGSTTLDHAVFIMVNNERIGSAVVFTMNAVIAKMMKTWVLAVLRSSAMTKMVTHTTAADRPT